MYCSKCGKPIDNGSIYCPNCGTKIENNQINNQFGNMNNNQMNNQFGNMNNNQINNQFGNMNNNQYFKNQSRNEIKIDINKVLIILIVFIIGLCIIGGINYILKEKKSRTIMIYMAGSDLESSGALATRDLRDLDYKKTQANNTNVVLIAGGSKSWHNNYIDATETSIYELKENGIVKVEKRKLDNMGETNNLSYFLNYVYNNYKSDKYDLIFWNHGGAVDGSEYDELNKNIIYGEDNLKPTEMKEAFENSPFNKNKKLEIISFRTCLNGTIEMANIFKEYAEYMVASEEVTYGSENDSALKFINDISIDDNAITYGKKEIEAYKENITAACNAEQRTNKKENYCVDITYSVTDLSKIDKLNKSLDEYSKDLDNSLNTYYSQLSKKRSNLNQYAQEMPEYDMVDLYNLVESNKEYSKNSDEVLTNIKDAVVYDYTNNYYSHGLSIYHPYNATSFLKTYDQITPAENYNKYINNFINIMQNNKTKSFSSFSNKEGTIKNKKKETADFEMDLTEEEVKNFAKANYTVFVDTKDGYYKRLYTGKKVELEGTILKAKVQGKLLKFSDIEYDDDSCWIDIVEKEVTDKYTDIYTVPILVRSMKYNVATVTIRIDDKHPNGYILSTVIKNGEKEKKDFAAFTNVGANINDYSYIQYASQKYKILDENGLFNPNYEGNGVYTGLEIPTNGFKYIREDFDSEYDYYAVFKIWDTSNNIYYSKLVKMN